ncbi:MAG: recombination regulator RecX [Betaproteobacteria bacterium]|nr:recombination regulator RecX [Betaproteobacteria bacterium]MBL8534973.1 recombination regulator RecX [Betaproteobacteria bacterium]
MTLGLRSRALSMLARREYARAELKKKLETHAGQDDDVDGLLDELERSGYLSDARFGEQLARRHGGRHGALKLEQALRSRGVTESVVESVVAAAREDEPARALAVLRRKYAAPPEGMDEWARQARYLRNRGFGLDVIRQVLRTPFEL